MNQRRIYICMYIVCMCVGIMQLFGACSPLVRSLLRKVSKNDLAPKLDEQRLDESGVLQRVAACCSVLQCVLDE